MTEIELSDSEPLDVSSLTAGERGWFEAWPKDLRLFYLSQNGGNVPEDKTLFKTPIINQRAPEEPRQQTAELATFWRLATQDVPYDGEIPSILHEHYDRHIAEQFLPRDVFVIGSCLTDSLLAVSLAKKDFGRIYYWEWYWQYPWLAEFFEPRLEAAREASPDHEALADGPESERQLQLFDALNYATLVEVGASFSDFVARLEWADP